MTTLGGCHDLVVANVHVLHGLCRLVGLEVDHIFYLHEEREGGKVHDNIVVDMVVVASGIMP